MVVGGRVCVCVGGGGGGRGGITYTTYTISKIVVDYKYEIQCC